VLVGSRGGGVVLVGSHRGETRVFHHHTIQNHPISINSFRGIITNIVNANKKELVGLRGIVARTDSKMYVLGKSTSRTRTDRDMRPRPVDLKFDLL
jgi:hypothetical protein